MNAGQGIGIVLFIFLSHSLVAQGVQRDFKDAVYPKRVTAYRVDNPFGSQDESISYDNIKGSPFWRDSLQPALLYSSQGYLGTFPVRINFATNEIYILKDSEEMVVNDNIIVKIVFKTSNDSTVFISQVANLLFKDRPLDGFVEVLTFGKFQLLKYTRRRLASAESPSHTSKSFYFTDDINYFIKSNEKVEFVKKLNKENLLIFLPSSSAYERWAGENAINFKNENDIVRFLNYYNVGSRK